MFNIFDENYIKCFNILNSLIYKAIIETFTWLERLESI